MDVCRFPDRLAILRQTIRRTAKGILLLLTVLGQFTAYDQADQVVVDNPSGVLSAVDEAVGAGIIEPGRFVGKAEDFIDGRCRRRYHALHPHLKDSG